MKTNIRKLVTAVAGAMALSAGSANAAIVVDDWTLNLTGIDGLGATTVFTIDQIGFNGVANSTQVIDEDGGAPDGTIEVNDISRTRGLLSATTFVSNGVNLLPGVTGLGVTYEMTFTFDVLGIATTAAFPSNDFTHLGLDADAATYGATGSTGLLTIYIDAFANGGVVANQLTGSGYSDGVPIAVFKVLPGLGGSFNALTFNGSDDAIFELVSATAGVIKDKTNTIDLGVPGQLLAVTASQFDADFNNDGTPDVPCPTVVNIGITTGPSAFCAQEDGRASLQTVPEPASLALVGLALAGLGVSQRKSRKQ